MQLRPFGTPQPGAEGSQLAPVVAGSVAGMVAGCCFGLLALAAVEIAGVVFAVVDLIEGHHHLVLDIVLIVVLVPGLVLTSRTRFTVAPRHGGRW
jgi:hypothetical protein